MLYRDRHTNKHQFHIRLLTVSLGEHHKACLYNVKSKALLKYNKLNLIYKHKQLYTDTMFNVFALIRHLNVSHSTSETTTKNIIIIRQLQLNDCQNKICKIWRKTLEYIYIYMCMCVCVCVYIYIYMCVCVCVCVCVYIYIYICVCVCV